MMKEFFERKRRAMEKLEEAISLKRVDEKAMPIIEKLNKMEGFYTTSSCSGRIVLLEIPLAGEKREARFLGKWHDEVESDDIIKALENAGKGEIWFLVQSPIFHVSASSLKNAKILLNVAIQSGFKYSSIKSIDGKIMVEILSTERIDAPIGKDGKLLVSMEYIKYIVSISNFLIKRMHEKLEKLEKNIERMQNILMAS